MVLGIYGAGGCGKEIKDIAEVLDVWEEIVFIDDTVEAGIYRNIKRIPFEIFCQNYDINNAEVIVALGEPEYKIGIYKKVREKGFSFANVIHPTVWISPSARLGKGIYAKNGAVISCDTVIGDNVGIEFQAIIGHDCIIDSGCQISPMAAIGGHCEIGRGTHLGMNVLIKEGTKIGGNSVLGMGSVVQRDIPENVIALGNPASVMKYKNDTKVFR